MTTSINQWVTSCQFLKSEDRAKGFTQDYKSCIIIIITLLWCADNLQPGICLPLVVLGYPVGVV